MRLLILSSVPCKCMMEQSLVFNFYPSIINSSPASRIKHDSVHIKIIYSSSVTKNLVTETSENAFHFSFHKCVKNSKGTLKQI